MVRGVTMARHPTNLVPIPHQRAAGEKFQFRATYKGDLLYKMSAAGENFPFLGSSQREFYLPKWRKNNT